MVSGETVELYVTVAADSIRGTTPGSVERTSLATSAVPAA
jgi:hypothetical protein